MRFSEQKAAVGAAILLLATLSEATHSHHKPLHLEVLERRHAHNHMKLHASPRAENHDESKLLDKRSTCAFPTNAGLVPVNPSGQNAGWAMSPDETCTAGKYCPYACPPGELMAQWDPSATSYTYPASMVGWYSHGDKTFANKYRMVASTVVAMARSPSHSQTSLIVTQEPVL